MWCMKSPHDSRITQPCFPFQLTHGGNSTIQGPINLSHFHHLTNLEVKRIPTHWIQGLRKLQGKLIIIKMSRSINYLEVIPLSGSVSIQRLTYCMTVSDCVDPLPYECFSYFQPAMPASRITNNYRVSVLPSE